ncbi:hypothetical protein JZ751_012856 [Albula glossodonta]|uniref:Uncharacterized protein n=1 Tax=Albula glossodonta TaxID=121402 RepID=A0A8T2MZW1_9TELE|nr:hypothetical protein JZ751_012856 [Albula glossodonta]
MLRKLQSLSQVPKGRPSGERALPKISHQEAQSCAPKTRDREKPMDPACVRRMYGILQAPGWCGGWALNLNSSRGNRALPLSLERGIELVTGRQFCPPDWRVIRDRMKAHLNNSLALPLTAPLPAEKPTALRNSHRDREIVMENVRL